MRKAMAPVLLLGSMVLIPLGTGMNVQASGPTGLDPTDAGRTVSARTDAGVLSVDPDEGTIGSRFTISGWGFGPDKPDVVVGRGRCRILEWGATDIHCVLMKATRAGAVDIRIRSGGQTIIRRDGFTVRAPMINPMAPTRIGRQRNMTVSGDFFGTERGQVRLIKDRERLDCRVLDWAMDSIRFVLPRGLVGVYDLSVSNSVGQGCQTHVLVSDTPEPYQSQQLLISDKDYWSETAATGVFYDSQLWAFYSGLWYQGVPPSDYLNCLQYRRLQDGAWKVAGPVKPGGNWTNSWYAPSPVVFRGTLYLFYLAHDEWQGTDELVYTIYRGVDPQSKDVWDSPQSLHLAPEGEVSAVYNPQQDRLELYYVRSTQIHWLYSTDGLQWSSSSVIPGIQTNSPPSAEAVDTGDGQFEIMLAARRPSDDTIQIIRTSEGAVKDSYCLDEWTKDRPFLTNLGQGFIALFWRSADGHPNFKSYEEKTRKWYDTLAFTDRTGPYPPTGVVNFDVAPDAMVGSLWMYYSWHHWRGTRMRDDMYSQDLFRLGMWKHVKNERKDWAQIEDAEIWNLYPVVGVIDGPPPFVLNGGSTASENGSKIDFGQGQTNATTMEYTMKAGVYVKKEKEIGMNAEVHAGITAQYSQEKTLDTTITYSLHAIDPIQIRVLYLAPVFDLATYQWYDDGDNPTDRTIVAPSVYDISLLARLIDPKTDPNFGSRLEPHEAGKLETYKAGLNPSLYDIDKSVTWDYGGPTTLSIVQSQTDVHGVGGYFSFSVGEHLSKEIGFGVEGDFEVKHSSKTTVTTSAVVTLDNPPPSVTGDVSHFTATVFWAKPNKNGFWVPLNRVGRGDEPWFITYRVTDIQR